MRLLIPDFDAVIDTCWFGRQWSSGDCGYDGTEPKPRLGTPQPLFTSSLVIVGGENEAEPTHQYVYPTLAALHLRRDVHEEFRGDFHGG